MRRMPLFTMPVAYFTGVLAAAGKLSLKLTRKGRHDTWIKVHVTVEVSVGKGLGGLDGALSVGELFSVLVWKFDMYLSTSWR